jgi:hypothetical protein
MKSNVNYVSTTEARQLRCGYDYLGRRISRSILTGSPVYYVYDGEDIIAEYSSTGTLLRKYIHGPGVDEPGKLKGSDTFSGKNSKDKT